MPVPKLDLAPKLKRPLSLWNPLDYLRLLYWVFYFPQALRWYVDTFGGGYIPDTEMSLRKGWQILRQNPVQRNLLFQGVLLTIIVPFLLCQFLEQIGVYVDWSSVAWGMVGSVAFAVTFSVAFGVVLGVAGGVTWGVAGSVAFGVTFGVTFGVIGGVIVGGVAIGMTFGMTLGVALGVVEGGAWGVTLGVVGGMAFGVTFGVAFGVAFGVVGSVVGGVAFGIEDRLVGGVAFGMAFGVALGVVGSVVGGVAFGIEDRLVGGVTFVVAFSVAVIRPDNWIVAMPLWLSIQNKSWSFPRITSLPLLKLSVHLQNWLYKDWETGVHNLNQLLQYSLQDLPVVLALNKVLAETSSEHIIYRLTQLAQSPYDWKLIGFTSASLSHVIKSQTIRGLLFFRYYNELFSTPLRVFLRIDTYPRAAAAGFWYLHEKKPDKATEAFAVVRDLRYGEEIYILAQTLALFHEATKTNKIANLTIPNFPTENLLRSTTWQTMNSLRGVVEDIKLIQHSASRNTKSFAYSRAIGELTEVIDNKDHIPEAERELIVDIAQTWKQSLERIGKEIGNVTITQPVRNPYVIGNPVTGSLFVGREDILRQLEALWITGNQLQSVVLYGHRRMGKSSILVNIANCTGAEVKVIYINLQRLGAVSQGVAEVLMAISDEIATAFNISSPDDDAFLKLPQRTFERYLKQVIENMPYRGLIIALDEFETIEDLIQRGQIEPTFMGFLRGLVQMNPEKIAFAFAGLHTLEEMTADYFQPFFASVIPIRVSFLSKGATKTILANPIADKFFEQSNSVHQSPLNPHLSKSLLKGETSDVSPTRGDKEGSGDFISPQNENDYPIMENVQPITPQAWGAGMAKISSFLTEIEANQNPENNEFLLDYTEEALDLIYSLTSGQPYLTQLIGFLLVRNYNNQVFEQGNPQDNTLTVKDIEAVINNNFFQQGRYYFEGVWGQAAQGVTGQQAIIKALAPHPQGLNLDNLVSATGLDIKTVEAAIATLIRHDVIQENNENYFIIVELFQRWVLNLT